MKIQQVIAGLSKWIITNPEINKENLYWFEGYSHKLNRMCKNHGLKQTVAVVKQTQLHLTRYLAGDPIFVNDLRIGIYHDGLPKDLRAVIHRVRSKEVTTLRFILTVMNAVRLIPGDGSLTPSSITLEASSDPSLIEDQIMTWLKSPKSEFGSSILKTFKQNSIKSLDWSLPHLSTKAGPNGQAIGTSLRDLQLLPDWLSVAIKKIGGKELSTYMFTLKDSISTVPDWVETISNKKFLRRLSVVRDRAMKNRPIAILDYWSQTALIGLHKTLFSVLRTLPSDCTFNQNHIMTLKERFQSFHCMDLTAATDRFPVSLQEKILAELVNPSYASAWRDIMTKLPFNHEGKEYHYTVGQPMGAYSSWAMFALSHHIVVQYAASLTGHKGQYEDYALLGDDIVIGHQEVADQYIKVINLLGVEISFNKTHRGNTLLEFTKRIWLNHEEITGFPLPGLFESMKNPFIMAQELTRAIERCTLDNTSVPVSTSLSNFFSCWMSKRSSERMTHLIQDWWSTIELDNWVNSGLSQNSPPKSIGCNHQPDIALKFFHDILLDKMEDTLKKLRVKLSQAIREAMDLNEQQAQRVNEFHEIGPDRDSLPNLHGIYFQPWFIVLEDQVNKVDHHFEQLKKARSTGQDISLEEIHTTLASVRLCSPKEIISTRTSDIAISNKRKQFGELLPYVRSQ